MVKLAYGGLQPAGAGPLFAGAAVGFGALLITIGAAAAIGDLVGNIAPKMNDDQRGCFVAGLLFPLWLLGFSRSGGAGDQMLKEAGQFLSGIGFFVSMQKVQSCWSW